MFKPAEKTFIETVKDIGTFEFRYPTILDDIRIGNTTSKILENNMAPMAQNVEAAIMIATLQIMTEDAPKGWNLEEIYDFRELKRVFLAYDSKVRQFRSSLKRADDGDGKQAGSDG